MRIITRLKNLVKALEAMSSSLTQLSEAVGRVENRQLIGLDSKELGENEFRAHSQWGEDGIIQFLIRNLNISERIFIEFGVENYVESNTRFLLKNNNWSGLVIDGSKSNIEFIKRDPIYWRHNLKAECAFITRDNINELFSKNGISGKIGLLSIDIDGNDYWVWEAIEEVDPAIVVMEYNARFGPESAVTVPYDPGFTRQSAHYSMIYFGASLRALAILGEKKGYALVGCNKAGVNAFFVRKDLLNPVVKEVSVEDCYVRNQFRESRNPDGTLAFLSPGEEEEIISNLPLVEVDKTSN